MQSQSKYWGFMHWILLALLMLVVNGQSSARAESFVGEIALFAFPCNPYGWLPCDGREMSVKDDRDLYFVIGATYGGDDRTTYKLPDLRKAEQALCVAAGVEKGVGNFRYMICYNSVGPGRDPAKKDWGPRSGEITLFAGDFAPTGWLLCDGSAKSIKDFSSTYSQLGTVYGGDGSKTFKVPDLRTVEQELRGDAGIEKDSKHLRYIVSQGAVQWIDTYSGRLTLCSGRGGTISRDFDGEKRSAGEFCKGQTRSYKTHHIGGLIGNRFGGDLKTNFKLPDLRKVEQKLRKAAGIKKATFALRYNLEYWGQIPIQPKLPKE